jgi:Zn-dependent peptidase ImmA (M78 family)
MQNGIVASNTHRKLDINEFRGFMLYDSLAPLIFVNANDSQAGKIFTLIHEYIHILFEKEDVFVSEDLSSVNTTEKSVNEITAEFLMPKAHVLSHWNQNEENLAEIEKLSKEFHVSKLALAIRLKDLSLAKQSLIDEVSAIMVEDLKNKKTAASGGDHYANHKSRYSESFIKTVIQGAEAGDISYTYAFKLLDAKASTYDYFKEDVVGYE